MLYWFFARVFWHLTFHRVNILKPVKWIWCHSVRLVLPIPMWTSSVRPGTKFDPINTKHLVARKISNLHKWHSSNFSFFQYPECQLAQGDWINNKKDGNNLFLHMFHRKFPTPSGGCNKKILQTNNFIKNSNSSGWKWNFAVTVVFMISALF